VGAMIRHCPFIAENCDDVVKAIQSGLKFIRCTNCGLGAEDAKPIGEALRAHRSNCEVVQLALGANKLGSVDACKLLGDALKNIAKLQDLDLGANRMDLESIKALREGLASNTCIEHLNLSYNLLGDEGMATLAEVIVENEALPLTELNLRMTQIGPSGAKELTKVINKKGTKFRVLNLSQNAIGTEGAAALSEALKENCWLRHLNLSGSPRGPNIGSRGAVRIGEALTMPQPLRSHTVTQEDRMLAKMTSPIRSVDKFNLAYLDLSANDINDEDGDAIGQGLKTNTSLKSLSLRCNLLGRKTGRSIAEALYTNASLKTLDLSQNRLGDKAADNISESLAMNRSLTTLDVSENKLSAVAAHQFLESIHDNDVLMKLVLGGNGIHTSSVQLDKIGQDIEGDQVGWVVNADRSGTIQKTVGQEVKCEVLLE